MYLQTIFPIDLFDFHLTCQTHLRRHGYKFWKGQALLKHTWNMIGDITANHGLAYYNQQLSSSATTSETY